MTTPVQATTFTEAVANGATTVFPYGFKIAAAEDLAVYLDGVKQTTGYTVSGAGNPAGGNVTFSVAPGNGVKVLANLEPILKRETDYQSFGDWWPSTVNLDFDRIWLAVQAVWQRTNRSIKLPSNTSGDQVITESATARASTIIGFDTLGNIKLYAAQVGTSLLDLLASSGASLVGFIQSGTGAVAGTVQGELRNIVRPTQFGADPTGATDSKAAFQRAFDRLSGVHGKVQENWGNFNFTAGGLSSVSGGNSYFDFSGSNLVLAADATFFTPAPTTGAVQTNERWKGGSITNSAVAPAASVAFNLVNLKQFTLEQAFIGGFKTGVAIGGYDTFNIKETYFSLNDDGIKTIVNPAGASILPMIINVMDCEFSVGGKNSGINLAKPWYNFTARGGSFSGQATSASIYATNAVDAGIHPRGFVLDGVHFEQANTGGKYVWLQDTGGGAYPFYGVNISGCTFGDAPAQAVRLERVTGARIEGNAFSGTPMKITGDYAANGVTVTNGSAVMAFNGTATTAGLSAGMFIFANGVPLGTTIQTVDSSTQVTMSAAAVVPATLTLAKITASFASVLPMYFDANCSNITLEGNALATPLVYLCSRNQVTCNPQVRFPTINAGEIMTLPTYNGGTFSTGATTINMQKEFEAAGGTWPAEAPPKGYWLNVNIADSGSAAAQPYVDLRSSSSVTLFKNALVDVGGITNGYYRGGCVFVPADQWGNIYIDRNASGANTLTIYISVASILM